MGRILGLLDMYALNPLGHSRYAIDVIIGLSAHWSQDVYANATSPMR